MREDVFPALPAVLDRERDAKQVLVGKSMSKCYQLAHKKYDRNAEVRQLTALESYRKDYKINEDEAFFEESSLADKLGGEYSLWKAAAHKR